MTFGSLFAGIGGLDLGLDRAGWRCVWQVEINPFCRQVLAARFPGVQQFEDITKTPTQALADVDCIVGGFPCQDLSQAGKRAGINGARSGLWFEYARIIGDLRPRHVVIENVPGLLVPGAMSRVVGELARLGYVGCWRSLRAAEFGASHLRKRVFIIAELDNSVRDGRNRSQREDGLRRGVCEASNELADSPGEQRRRQPLSLRGSTLPAGTCAAGPGNELADSASRGRGERGEPSGSGGLPDGSLRRLEDSRRAGERRPSESAGIDRPGASGDDCRASGALDVPDSGGAGLPDTEQSELPGAQRIEERRAVGELCGAHLADSNGGGCGIIGDAESESELSPRNVSDRCDLPQFAPGPSDPRWPAILAERPDLAPALEAKPAVRGLAHGISAGVAGDWHSQALDQRTAKLRALGNAVVPQIAQWIASRIIAREA